MAFCVFVFQQLVALTPERVQSMMADVNHFRSIEPTWHLVYEIEVSAAKTAGRCTIQERQASTGCAGGWGNETRWDISSDLPTCIWTGIRA